MDAIKLHVQAHILQAKIDDGDLIGNTATTLSPGQELCDASDDDLQSPILELDIKANVHGGVETCLRCPDVSACNLPLQHNMSNVGKQCITCSRFLACENCSKRPCNASNDDLQSPILELVIKANVYGGVETCLRCPCVSACNLPLQDNMSNVGKQRITCSRFLACENFLKRQWNKPLSRCITCISQSDCCCRLIVH
jgi:hypothetical protein